MLLRPLRLALVYLSSLASVPFILIKGNVSTCLSAQLIPTQWVFLLHWRLNQWYLKSSTMLFCVLNQNILIYDNIQTQNMYSRRHITHSSHKAPHLQYLGYRAHPGIFRICMRRGFSLGICHKELKEEKLCWLRLHVTRGKKYSSEKVTFCVSTCTYRSGFPRSPLGSVFCVLRPVWVPRLISQVENVAGYVVLRGDVRHYP